MKRFQPIFAHPLRDGRSGGSFVSIELADGKVISAHIRAP